MGCDVGEFFQLPVRSVKFFYLILKNFLKFLLFLNNLLII